MSKKPVFDYYKAGPVERGPRYGWRDGYSLNGNTYPWLTKREAQRDARARGGKAKIHETSKKEATA